MSVDENRAVFVEIKMKVAYNITESRMIKKMSFLGLGVMKMKNIRRQLPDSRMKWPMLCIAFH